MAMLSDHLHHLPPRHFKDDSTLVLAEHLSRMLCFRLDTIQYICLSERSLAEILTMSRDLIAFACHAKVHALLNLAIDVFSALTISLEIVSCVGAQQRA